MRNTASVKRHAPLAGSPQMRRLRRPDAVTRPAHENNRTILRLFPPIKPKHWENYGELAHIILRAVIAQRGP